METDIDVAIPDRLVTCAAANFVTGAETMQLLQHRFGHIKITNEVMEVTALQGTRQTMEY